MRSMTGCGTAGSIDEYLQRSAALLGTGRAGQRRRRCQRSDVPPKKSWPQSTVNSPTWPTGWRQTYQRPNMIRLIHVGIAADPAAACLQDFASAMEDVAGLFRCSKMRTYRTIALAWRSAAGAVSMARSADQRQVGGHGTPSPGSRGQQIRVRQCRARWLEPNVPRALNRRPRPTALIVSDGAEYGAAAVWWRETAAHHPQLCGNDEVSNISRGDRRLAARTAAGHQYRRESVRPAPRRTFRFSR